MCTPDSFSPQAATHYVAALLHRDSSTNYFNPLPHQHLVGKALEAAKPAHSRMFFAYMALLSRFQTPIWSQAGASLVWGHEKFEFEDDHGYQWRAWFNECGRAFKIKAAWGHPEIVRKHPSSIFEPLQYMLTVVTSSIYIVDYR